jgi:hypothetical protein
VCGGAERSIRVGMEGACFSEEVALTTDPSWVQWLRPVIPATWEVEMGRLRFNASIRKEVNEIPLSVNKLCVFSDLFYFLRQHKLC